MSSFSRKSGDDYDLKKAIDYSLESKGKIKSDTFENMFNHDLKKAIENSLASKDPIMLDRVSNTPDSVSNMPDHVDNQWQDDPDYDDWFNAFADSVVPRLP